MSVIKADRYSCCALELILKKRGKTHKRGVGSSRFLKRLYFLYSQLLLSLSTHTHTHTLHRHESCHLNGSRQAVPVRQNAKKEQQKRPMPKQSRAVNPFTPPNQPNRSLTGSPCLTCIMLVHWFQSTGKSMLYGIYDMNTNMGCKYSRMKKHYLQRHVKDGSTSTRTKMKILYHLKDVKHSLMILVYRSRV